MLNYTRIENAHKVRKKSFVFYHVVVICATTGARDGDAGAAVEQGQGRP